MPPRLFYTNLYTKMGNYCSIMLEIVGLNTYTTKERL